MKNQSFKPVLTTLQIQQFASQMLISDDVIALANTDVICDRLYDVVRAHRITIRSRMAGQVVETHKYPTTWLDAFKLRWFPKFLLNKYPVNFTTVKTWECYPDYAFPHSQNTIQYFSITKDQTYENLS